jgi:hypothetical protein
MAESDDERLAALRNEVETLKAEKSNQKLTHDQVLQGLEKQMVAVTRTMHDRGAQIKQLQVELKVREFHPSSVVLSLPSPTSTTRSLRMCCCAAATTARGPAASTSYHRSNPCFSFVAKQER